MDLLDKMFVYSRLRVISIHYSINLDAIYWTNKNTLIFLIFYKFANIQTMVKPLWELPRRSHEKL